MGSLRVRHDERLHFHALEKEMAIHSSILAWRIPRMGEPGGLPSVGSHRVGHYWSDLAAAASHRQIFQAPAYRYRPRSHVKHEWEENWPAQHSACPHLYSLYDSPTLTESQDSQVEAPRFPLSRDQSIPLLGLERAVMCIQWSVGRSK